MVRSGPSPRGTSTAPYRVSRNHRDSTFTGAQIAHGQAHHSFLSGQEPKALRAAPRVTRNRAAVRNRRRHGSGAMRLGHGRQMRRVRRAHGVARGQRGGADVQMATVAVQRRGPRGMNRSSVCGGGVPCRGRCERMQGTLRVRARLGCDTPEDGQAGQHRNPSRKRELHATPAMPGSWPRFVPTGHPTTGTGRDFPDDADGIGRNHS